MRERSKRQSFLGGRSDEILQDVVVGIIGLGGGGSHVAQQLAHIGITHFILYDPQTIEETNLNRLVGATRKDVDNEVLKTIIAERLITNVNPETKCIRVEKEWQEQPEFLRGCDAIFGCLDSFMAREQLEKFSRRFLIPYFDIGMDVHDDSDHFSITGQVMRSIPGEPCMRCVAILAEADMTEEARRYGAAGDKPQVVWSNAILASTAVGLFMGMISPWKSGARAVAALDYDGNENTLEMRGPLEYVKERECRHFSLEDVGDPFFSLDKSSSVLEAIRKIA